MTEDQIKEELKTLIGKLDDTRDQQLLASVLLSVTASFISGNIDNMCSLTTVFSREFIRQREYVQWVQEG